MPAQQCCAVLLLRVMPGLVVLNQEMRILMFHGLATTTPYYSAADTSSTLIDRIVMG